MLEVLQSNAAVDGISAMARQHPEHMPTTGDRPPNARVDQMYDTP